MININLKMFSKIKEQVEDILEEMKLSKKYMGMTDLDIAKELYRQEFGFEPEGKDFSDLKGEIIENLVEEDLKVSDMLNRDEKYFASLEVPYEYEGELDDYIDSIRSDMKEEIDGFVQDRIDFSKEIRLFHRLSGLVNNIVKLADQKNYNLARFWASNEINYLSDFFTAMWMYHFLLDTVGLDLNKTAVFIRHAILKREVETDQFVEANFKVIARTNKILNSEGMGRSILDHIHSLFKNPYYLLAKQRIDIYEGQAVESYEYLSEVGYHFYYPYNTFATELKESGGLFPYWIKCPITYQRLVDAGGLGFHMRNSKNEVKNCLSEALETYGINVHFKAGDSLKPSKILPGIAKEYDVKIRLFHLKTPIKNKFSDNSNNTYGNSEKLITLILYKNHYLPHNRILFRELKNLDHNFTTLTEEMTIDDLKCLIRKVDKEATLTKIEENEYSFKGLSKRKVYSRISKRIKNLKYGVKIDPQKYEEIEIIEPNRYLAFWDIESCVNDVHKPYCVSYILWDDYLHQEIERKSFYGLKCIKSFVDHLKSLRKGVIKVNPASEKYSHIIAFAHFSSRYDSQFLKPYYHFIEECNSGCNRPILFNTWDYAINQNVEFRDSYSYVPNKLEKFPKMFKLDYHKMWFPYNAIKTDYKTLHNKKLRVNVSDDERSLIDKEESKFIIQEGSETFINVMEYTKEYCMNDVVLLKNGLLTFFELLRSIKVASVNPLDSLSISGVAHDIIMKCNAYEGVPMIRGNLAKFVRKCLYGGRCLIGKDYKFVSSGYDPMEKKTDIPDDDFIQDVDAVSLYPTACSDLEIGCGIPTILNKINFWDLFDQGKIMYVKVKVNGFRKRSYIPSVSGEEGYKNRPCHYYLDYYSLRSLLKHQVDRNQIEFISGFYFPEKTGKILNDVIKDMFSLRLKFKKEGNPIQAVYKLILNSIYGKTIFNHEKAREVRYVPENELKKFVSYNIDRIQPDFVEIDKKYRFELRNTNYMNEWSFCHIGVLVLGHSKEIMNDIIQPYNEDVMYTDTDSFFIKNSVYEKIVREHPGLIGKQMGQFHSDIDEEYKGQPARIVYAMFLSKKMYILHILCDTKNGKKVDPYIQVKMTLKGVPLAFRNEDMYHQLEMGHTVELGVSSVDKPKFCVCKSGRIETNTDSKKKLTAQRTMYWPFSLDFLD